MFGFYPCQFNSNSMGVFFGKFLINIINLTYKTIKKIIIKKN